MTTTPNTTTDTPIPPSEARKLRLGRVVVWVLLAAVIGVLGVAVVRSFNTPAASGRAPDFTLTTYDGETYTLSELEGQVVVLNFWASWCAPCIEEAPDLERAWQEYRDQGVTFLGVGYVDTEEGALGFIEEHGITYPTGPDLRTQISQAYNVRAVPETFIINPAGEVVLHTPGTISYGQLSRAIEAALR